MCDWKTIETAKTDGRPVLLWDGLPFVARFRDGEWLTPDGDVVECATLWSEIKPPFGELLKSMNAHVFDETPELLHFDECEAGDKRAYIQPRQGLIGFWLFGRYISLKSSAHREYWSERNRLGCRVFYLPFGWRLTIRALQEQSKESR